MILQVPHAFQQVLSSEKTPTLHHALPSFRGMITTWTAMRAKKPQFASIIDAGIEKLEEYMEMVEDVPAYTLAIRMFDCSAQCMMSDLIHCIL